MGVGAVYASGKDTELGLIAKLSTETKKISQYEQSLQSFSTSLIKIILIVLAIVFIVKLFLTSGHSNIPSLLLFIIALSVSTVPEVLPVIATVTLSSGAMKLTKKHVVVKRLSAIEDLGNVDLLCTDKTGTLTENKMTIANIVSDDTDLFQKLAYASVTPLKDRKRRIQNTYDDAFIKYVPQNIAEEAKNFVLIKDLPFDPNDRRSRTIIENKIDKKYYLVVSGAPESIFEISSSIKKSEYLADISKEGNTGLHHLALAYKEIDYSENFDILKNENNLKFLGYVALVDPLRPTAKSAIEKAEKMGIKIKVLTGDSREVAEYVGIQVGLVQSGDTVYLGSELEKMNEKDFATAVHETNVFARVTPEQKFAIIKALKKDYVVAYQGDGINDAPALKLADVAVAVNSATDIAKENADIVLLNKSLEVITNGVVYGRSIFINVNKYIKYTMANNFGILIALSILYLFSSILPILPIQALLNNLIGDIPLITVFSDNVDDEEIVKPEKHNMKEMIFISLVLGLPTAIFEIVYFVFIRLQPEKMVQTSLYVFLTFQALVIFYVVRTKKHFWNAKRPSTLMNIFFLLAFIVSLSVIYIPKFQTWFSFVPLTLSAIGVIFGLMILYFLSADFVKVRYYGWIATLPE
jgi:Mg2+-importing ATPase